MKEFSTLVGDIYEMVNNGDGGTTDLTLFKDTIANKYVRQTSWEYRARKPESLYFSEIGTPCKRQLWYRVNIPHIAEPVTGSGRIKFAYGDILEAMVLQLAKDAGHTVEQEQGEISYGVGTTGWYINGRLDAIIDGVVVDVKSVTKYSVQKFEKGLADDPFGYYDQLNGYTSALGRGEASFLTIEKELGNIKAFPLHVDKELFEESVENAVATVTGPVPTVRQDVVELDNGNKKLCTMCSYCSFKHHCWQDSNGGVGLRTFVYSNGPVFLTEVKKVPLVLEVVSG